jgi:CubicO group peptidase (beta-lactamase class C family)
MKKCILWLALCWLMVPVLVQAQAAEKQQPPSSPSAQMDKLFDFWNRLDQPGFAVVVVKDGQVAYQKAFGVACQEHLVPLTLNSIFNTATLAEIFVGQAVAMLEEQGKLNLDDDIRKFIPEIPDFGTPVKLRHLLFQSSGLRDWLPVLQLTGRDKEELTLENVLKIVKAQKQLLFPPGDRFQYSNTNYDLLAEAIKRATGQPFSDWAWENIFRPLKMTRTQFRDNCRAIIDDQAFSYNFTSREYLRGIDNLSLAGSHSLFTSIADLTKWLLNIESGSEEGQDIFAKMFTAGALNSGQASSYGYGLNITARSGMRVVLQTGTWAGSGAFLGYCPDLKFGFVVLANWDYTPVDGFAGDIADIYLPAPAPPPPVKKAAPETAEKGVEIGPEKLDQYAGDYRLSSRQILAISRAGDQLVLSVSGQKLALTTLSETEFFLDVAQARITFQKNKEGKVQQLVLKQGEDEQMAPKVVLVKPTPEELQEFSGAYFNEELNLRFVLEVRDAGLVLIPSEQAEVRLSPDEKDRFVSRAQAYPMIFFQRDDQNRVTGFIIESDPVRDLVFKKI